MSSSFWSSSGGPRTRVSVPIRQQMGYVFSDFRDGMVGEVHSYRTWQQALKAVGLEE